MLKSSTIKLQSLATLIIPAFTIPRQLTIIFTNKALLCNANAQELPKNPSIARLYPESSLKQKINLNSVSKNETLV